MIGGTRLGTNEWQWVDLARLGNGSVEKEAGRRQMGINKGGMVSRWSHMEKGIGKMNQRIRHKEQCEGDGNGDQRGREPWMDWWDWERNTWTSYLKLWTKSSFHWSIGCTNGIWGAVLRVEQRLACKIINISFTGSLVIHKMHIVTGYIIWVLYST